MTDMVIIDDSNHIVGLVCWILVGVLLLTFIIKTEYHISKLILIPIYFLSGIIFWSRSEEEKIKEQYLEFRSQINSQNDFSLECISNNEKFLTSLNHADTLITNLGVKNVTYTSCNYSHGNVHYSIWECEKKNLGQFYYIKKNGESLFGFQVK